MSEGRRGAALRGRSERGALWSGKEVWGRRKKVLLVDDSETALMLGRIVLQKRPYDVVTARDGSEAIRLAIEERPDLIIMDVVMPGLDGFQALRRIRSIEHTKNVPVFLLMSRRDPDSAAHGFACGCTEFLRKPLDGIELLVKLMRHLGE